MKKALFLFLTFSLFNLAFAQHDDHALTNAKVGHDASHRVGKLVDTGKIDEMYLKNMTSIEVKAIPHTNHKDPAFSAVISAGIGDAQVLLKFDMAGKFLPPHQVVGQSEVSENPWDVDSAELLEAALHWVMGATSPTINLAPFNKELSKASLKQQKSEDGTIQPVVLLSSEASSKVLQVVLSSKGDIISFSLVE